MNFDWWMLPVAAALFFYLVWIKERKGKAYSFSSLSVFGSIDASKLIKLKKKAAFLYLAAFIFLLGALLDPFFETSRTIQPPPPAVGAAFYLILDQSGSMVQNIDKLKKVTEEFISKRPTDLIGLVGFARSANLLSPLTNDHRALIEKLHNFTVVNDKSFDGTAIGYALYKSVQLVEATKAYTSDLSKGFKLNEAALILITDGFQYPHPEDKGNRLRTMGILDAAEAAKKAGIKVYLISIDKEIGLAEYAPHRRLMSAAAEMTGGQFFQSDSFENLSKIYSDIDKMEVSKVPLPKPQVIYERSFSFSFGLIGLALATFVCFILLDSFFLRRIP